MYTMEELNGMIEEIKKYEMSKKEMENNITLLKNTLKAYMKDKGVDEFNTDKYIVRNKAITSNRFDTTRFKKEHIDLYESYTVESTSERFTIN